MENKVGDDEGFVDPEFGKLEQSKCSITGNLYLYFALLVCL